MTVLYTPQIGKEYVYVVTDQRDIPYFVDLSDEEGPTCSCLRIQVGTAINHPTHPHARTQTILYSPIHSSICLLTPTQQRDYPCMHVLAIYCCRNSTRTDPYPIPDWCPSLSALISPLYALSTLVRAYAAVPLMPQIPPLKKDGTVFPPLASVEVVGEEEGGGKKRARTGPIDRTCNVQEAHRLGAPLTEAGEAFLAALTEEGEGEEEEADGHEGGQHEGEASSEGGEEQEGTGGESARQLQNIARVASYLRTELADRKELSYKSVVERSSGRSQALLTWLLPLLRRRGFITVEPRGEDYIISAGPRFDQAIEADGDVSDEDEAEIAQQQQLVRQQLQEEARQQQQRPPQQGQEGGGGKRRRARGTSCFYCHSKKIKCGRHPRCLNREEAGEGGPAGAGGWQEAAGDDEGEEEGAAAAAAAAAADEEVEEEDDKEDQGEKVASAELGPHLLEDAPRRPLVWGLRLWERVAFSATLPGPPPPRERLRSVGRNRNGRRKRLRIPNGGSQLTRLQASQG